MYPYPYPDGMDTEWHLQVEPGSYIVLTFHVLDVQSRRPNCMEDYVEIYDYGSTGEAKKVAHICNVKKPSGSYSSSWNRMKVRMVSDDAFATGGFMAEYHSKTFEIPNKILEQIKFDGKLSTSVE